MCFRYTVVVATVVVLKVSNIIGGDNFKLSREVLSAKCTQPVVERFKGNRPQAAVS